MNREKRLYYFGCVLLWWVLAAFDGCTEDMISVELDRRSRAISVKLDDLALWLFDEVFSAGDQDDISEEDAKSVYSKIEDLEPLEIAWIDKVRAAARDSGKGVADLEGSHVYYFAFGWVLRILSEFDGLLRDMNSDELYQRYLEVDAKSRKLADGLRGELSYIADCQGVSKEETDSLRATMETLTEQLAIEWREKVYELAKA